ncbi:MAG: 16S rRNA (cytosine(967)-C(5))-methyltransferase RsmB [Caldisericaceae bacterium]|nr:16S rRNA (cytosine(967)-C(5))-methyltransferase RsmB [Caldisericaceae bacterium]
MIKKPKSARALAYEVLFKFEKTFDRLDDLSDRALAQNELSSRERRFFKNLTSGVVRHRLYLDWIGSQLYRGRYKKLLIKFKVLLRQALFELIFMNAIPDHAAVNEYVNLTKKKLNPFQAKLMNGLLRNFLRQKKDFLPPLKISDPIKRLSVQYSFPEWLIKRWIGFWGEEETEALCKKMNEPPDFDIHINKQKISPKKFKNLLLEKKVPFKEVEYDSGVLRVNDLQPFLRERWFEKGYCVVQDESAALVADQIELKEGSKILDMCAAPGGKYVQLLKKKPAGAVLVAADIDFVRLKKVKQNVERLGLKGGLFVVADGKNPPFKTGGFDQILIDAPCTGLGVIRKHPDIKWRRKFEEIVEFSKIQEDLLEAADAILKPGGKLIYSTCTVDYFENENVAQEFLSKHAQKYQLQQAKAPDPTMLNEGFVRIQPQQHNMDGGFCAVFLKK